MRDPSGDSLLGMTAMQVREGGGRTAFTTGNLGADGQGLAKRHQCRRSTHHPPEKVYA